MEVESSDLEISKASPSEIAWEVAASCLPQPVSSSRATARIKR